MTAELAMALPVLVLVAAGLVWTLAVGADQLRMIDAARETARALARGDEQAAAVAAGRRVAPDGARFEVAREGGTVTVRVSGPAAEGGIAAALIPEITLRAEAVAAVEAVPP